MPAISVKLRVLVEADLEYAKMLKQFFQENDVNNYLDMTIIEFRQFCEGKADDYLKQFMEALKKRDNGRNSHL